MITEITYIAICRNNVLIILDAMAANESQTGRSADEDIVDLSSTLGQYNYCTRNIVNNGQTLVAVIKSIEAECKAGVLLPALHFEAHGDSEKGLLIADSNEYVSWHDLAALIAPINAATHIIVVLASCHGFVLWKLAVINYPCPFHYLIAPDQEVSTGVISDCILPSYKVLMESGQLNQAVSLLDSSFQRLIAGEWFYRTLSAFFTTSYTAKLRAEMVERIIDAEVARLGFNDRQLGRMPRARAKRHLANPRNFYEGIEKSFFHGKSKVPYTDMDRFVTHLKRFDDRTHHSDRH